MYKPLLDLINTVSHKPLEAGDFTLSEPTAITPTTKYNTEITITGNAELGFINNYTFKYKRILLDDLLPNLAQVSVKPNSGTKEVIEAINDIYSLDLDPNDFEDIAISESGLFTLIAKESSLKYTGGLDLVANTYLVNINSRLHVGILPGFTW
jgi:hypothetical protein